MKVAVVNTSCGEMSEGYRKYLKNIIPRLASHSIVRFCKMDRVPTVNMVRNMELFVKYRKDNPFTRRIKLRIQYLAVKIAVFKLTRTIAVSNYVKDFLVTKWKVPETGVRAVYHGCDFADELNANYEPPFLLPEEIKKNNFLFTTGNIRPYNGLEDIFRALIEVFERPKGKYPKCSNCWHKQPLFPGLQE